MEQNHTSDFDNSHGFHLPGAWLFHPWLKRLHSKSDPLYSTSIAHVCRRLHKSHSHECEVAAIAVVGLSVC